MGLKFREIYRLTNLGGNYLPGSMVVIGVRPDVDEPPDTAWQFLVNNEVHGGHAILGKILSELADGTVEVLDSDRKGDDGGSVIWRFEPLTLARFLEMVDEGDVGGDPDVLRSTFKSDAEVREFYEEKYLDDWWQEFPE